jgi:hypothetical protein
VLEQVQEYLRLTPKEEVWRIPWPDPTEWYDCLSRHWPGNGIRSTIQARDLRSTGLPSEGRSQASLYLTDTVLDVALANITCAQPEAPAFYLGMRCILPVGLTQRWMDLGTKKEKQLAINRWKAKYYMITCQEINTIVNVAGNHWMTIVIDIQRNEIRLMDSLKTHPSRLTRAIQTAKIILLTVSSHKKSGNPRVKSSETPTQPNGYDCGLCAVLSILGHPEQINNRTSLRNIRAWITWVMVDIITADLKTSEHHPPQQNRRIYDRPRQARTGQGTYPA